MVGLKTSLKNIELDPYLIHSDESFKDLQSIMNEIPNPAKIPINNGIDIFEIKQISKYASNVLYSKSLNKRRKELLPYDKHGETTTFNFSKDNLEWLFNLNELGINKIKLEIMKGKINQNLKNTLDHLLSHNSNVAYKISKSNNFSPYEKIAKLQYSYENIKSLLKLNIDKSKIRIYYHHSSLRDISYDLFVESKNLMENSKTHKNKNKIPLFWIKESIRNNNKAINLINKIYDKNLSDKNFKLCGHEYNQITKSYSNLASIRDNNFDKIKDIETLIDYKIELGKFVQNHFNLTQNNRTINFHYYEAGDYAFKLYKDYHQENHRKKALMLYQQYIKKQKTKSGINGKMKRFKTRGLKKNKKYNIVKYRIEHLVHRTI
jgi:hypothetical protein